MRHNDAQFCLKLSSPLREQLAADAKARGRSVANLIRKILIEHYVAQNATPSATPDQPRT
jgi:hypothetical protein